MHGRPVAVREVYPATESDLPCSDCGEKAKLAIYEFPVTLALGGSAVWYWCGSCDIGG